MKAHVNAISEEQEFCVRVDGSLVMAQKPEEKAAESINKDQMRSVVKERQEEHAVAVAHARGKRRCSDD